MTVTRLPSTRSATARSADLAAPATTAADRVQVAAAGEDAQPAEHPLRLGLEQVVAPGDRVAQGLLAGGGRATAGRSEVEASLEPRQQRLRATAA